MFLHEGLWKLWTLCMSKANWETNSVKLEGVTQPVKLQPGSLLLDVMNFTERITGGAEATKNALRHLELYGGGSKR